MKVLVSFAFVIFLATIVSALYLGNNTVSEDGRFNYTENFSLNESFGGEIVEGPGSLEMSLLLITDKDAYDSNGEMMVFDIGEQCAPGFYPAWTEPADPNEPQFVGILSEDVIVSGCFSVLFYSFSSCIHVEIYQFLATQKLYQNSIIAISHSMKKSFYLSCKFHHDILWK